DVLANGLFASPDLAPAGQALMAALGDDPELAAAFQDVVAAMGKRPTVLALAKRLMKDNPSASPERIGELAAKQMGDAFERPEFDRANDAAFKSLFDRKDVAAALDRLGESIANNPRLMKRIESLIAS